MEQCCRYTLQHCYYLQIAQWHSVMFTPLLILDFVTPKRPKVWAQTPCYCLCFKEEYSKHKMGQIKKSVAFFSCIATVADECCPSVLSDPVLERVINTGELGGRNFSEKSPLLSGLVRAPFSSSDFHCRVIVCSSTFFFLFPRTGAVFKPRDPGLCWICQPAKSGSPQIGEERIWVHVDGGGWVWQFFLL